CQPIIVNTDDAPGTMTRGHCGGIVINGYAKTNVVNSCAGDSSASEGGAIGYYGGNDDNDNSGTLRYVRVEFSGKEISPNNELNSDATVCSGRSNSSIANMTIIGDHRVGAAFPGPTSGVNFRRGTGGSFINSIVYSMKTAALKVDDDATWQAHCLAPPAAPAV